MVQKRVTVSRSGEPSGTGLTEDFIPHTKPVALQVPLGSRDLLLLPETD
jgi:hypothetical protein